MQKADRTESRPQKEVKNLLSSIFYFLFDILLIYVCTSEIISWVISRHGPPMWWGYIIFPFGDLITLGGLAYFGRVIILYFTEKQRQHPNGHDYYSNFHKEE